MTDPKFTTHREARAAGWFSRRHKTNEAHREAVQAYRHEHGRKARQRKAAERAHTREVETIARRVIDEHGETLRKLADS